MPAMENGAARCKTMSLTGYTIWSRRVWLIRSGWKILGGSYGGYATLAGVAFTPDVYRAAVDIVGPANLITLLEAIPPYWEAARKIMYARMADLGTPAGKTWLKERSPLTAADKIKTPLLVVQGANDPRVNRREAEQIVVALRDRGFPVEYRLRLTRVTALRVR